MDSSISNNNTFPYGHKIIDTINRHGQMDVINSTSFLYRNMSFVLEDEGGGDGGGGGGGGVDVLHMK